MDETAWVKTFASSRSGQRQVSGVLQHVVEITRDFTSMPLKLVVACPANVVTGGPEALHQLVHTANEWAPGTAAIWYLPDGTAETPSTYQHYLCPVIRRSQIPSHALLVLPEIWPEVAPELPNPRALWWLSLGNFGTHGQTDLQRIVLNLCQSTYAYRALAETPDKLMLTDWVSLPSITEITRRDMIAVNPAKNAGLLEPYRQATADIPFVYLTGCGPLQVSQALHGARIYIDFGRHPGRDRLPREAALAGCVVLSTRNGAAACFEDMPLDDYFKFDSLAELSARVREILAAPEQFQAAQKNYRQWVQGQRDTFRAEVRRLLDYLAR